MNCKTFQDELTDLILTAEATPSLAAAAHMKACTPCAEEYIGFQRTFSLLDTWQAPAPSPYFDQKLAVRLREELAAPPMGWFEALATRIRLNTGRNFRPALAGALALALLATGGSVATVMRPLGHGSEASATVRDLQILDRNEQAFQQLDELQQEDGASPSPSSDTGTVTEPTT